MLIKNAWYVASWAADVTDKPFARTFLDEPVVLFRDSAGRIAAIEDRCCHRGFPLVHGRVVGDVIQCGYHGLEFDRTGRCVRIPHQDMVPGNAVVRSYPVVEQDDLIWIWMGEASQADPSGITPYPWHKEWPYKASTYHVECSYELIIDNLLDLTHLAFVHSNTVGGAPDEQVKAEMKVTPHEKGVHFIRWLRNSVPPPTYVRAVGFKGRVDRWQDFDFVAPSAVLQFTGALDVGAGAYEKGKRDGGFALRIFHGMTPETEHTAHYFWSAAHGYRRDEPAVTAGIFQEIETAFRQDEFVLKEQYARVRAFPDRNLIDVRADAARVQGRRVLDRLIREDATAARGANLAVASG
jgi:vanillate O-demethylase monooxygenase subunit